MQPVMHRLAALDDSMVDTSDEDSDEQPGNLGEVVVLSTAHSWNPQKLLRRSAAGDPWGDAAEQRLQLSQQPSQQQPLRSQLSQQLSIHPAVHKSVAGKPGVGLQRATLVVMACLSW